MPVIRVTKTTNYTVISNYPLRDSRLSLKACALLCKMLCNADTWDYSITGMATQCKDGKSAVSNAMKELEQYGYLVRRQHRNERGQIVDEPDRAIVRRGYGGYTPESGMLVAGGE